MENNETKYIVYCTTNIVNKFIYIGVHQVYPFEPFYIGNGCYVNEPSGWAHPKTRFQGALKKYGVKNFVRSTIKEFDNEEDAYLLEAELVNEEFLKRPDVYNMVLGGKSSWIYNAKTLYQYDLTGKLIGEYRCLKEAALNVERNMTTIWSALRGKRKAANSFWSYEKYEQLDLSLFHIDEVNRGLPIFQFSDKGEYECCYESIRDCARIIGTSDANLGVAVKLGTKCNGKYYSDEFALTFTIAKSEKIKNTIIYQYDLDGNFIKEWESANKARKSLGFTSDIYKAIKLGRTAGGYQWSLEKLPKLSKYTPKCGTARKVAKYDLDGNLVKVFDKITDAKKEDGSGLMHVLNGRDKTHKGFVYKYLNR